MGGAFPTTAYDDMSSANVTRFNYILTGAGLAGLSLAVELARRPFFADKKIVLLDREPKNRNDRTWCFWAREAEPMPPVVFRRWEHCHFWNHGFHAELAFSPYRYHMIRGADFYEWAKKTLRLYPNVSWRTADIQTIDHQNGLVKTSEGDFQGDLIFNSAVVRTPLIPTDSPLFKTPFSVKPNPSPEPRKSIFLLQHFKGWLIETDQAAFDPERPVFMDFRVKQHGETRFVYVLPFSTTEALVEFTVFSPALLPAETYDVELRAYLDKFLKIKAYRIVEQEFGIIPMTDLAFPARAEGKTIHIGTAGGFVKASSGYAFLRTQRRIRAFVDAWEKTGSPDPGVMQSKRRFRMLDSIFLRVLADQGGLGQQVFSRLFQQLPTPVVLRFLDEDATFADILRVVSAPPTVPFLRAALRQIPQLPHV